MALPLKLHSVCLPRYTASGRALLLLMPNEHKAMVAQLEEAKVGAVCAAVGPRHWQAWGHAAPCAARRWLKKVAVVVGL